MKRLWSLVGIGFFIALQLFAITAYAVPAASPIGYWKTIDDVTGQPKSILKIAQSDGVLYGQIIKIFPKPGKDQNETCDACRGDKHNQKIVGMVIMTGLTQDKSNPNIWNGGRILDPQNGKTYRCYVQATDNAQRLQVRGYIGISLFGRSQTWQRVTELNG